MSETITFERKCAQCGETSVHTVDKEKFMRWQKGELIQRVFPEMTADQREIMITGIHPECWKIIFGSGDDDGA